MLRKLSIVLGFTIVLEGFVFAHTLDKMPQAYLKALNSDQVQQLYKAPLISMHDLLNKLQYVPNDEAIKNIVASIPTKNLAFCMEMLAVLPSKNKQGPLTLEQVYNATQKISSLKGLKYYSKHHKKWQVLFPDSYRIKKAMDKSSANRLNDFQLTAHDLIPPYKKIIAYEKDNVFGDAYAQLEYFFDTKSQLLTIVNTNLSPYKIWLFTAVPVKGMNLHIFIRLFQNHLVFYAVGADYSSVLTRNLARSFGENHFEERVQALYSWFIKNLYPGEKISSDKSLAKDS